MVSTPNYRAVGLGSNLDVGAEIVIFYSQLFSYISDGILCRRSSHLKKANFYHCKNNYRLEMITLFYNNNLSIASKCCVLYNFSK